LEYIRDEVHMLDGARWLNLVILITTMLASDVGREWIPTTWKSETDFPLENISYTGSG
jgi:hypothetical protein